MRKLAIAMALASTALATPAVARDQSWYVGVEGGAMLVEDTEFDLEGTYDDLDFLYDDAITINHKYGVDIDLIAGYDFGAFRAEAEVGYKRASIDEIETSGDFADGEAFDVDGSVRVWSAMVNFLFDFGDDDGWSGFVGPGIGLANVRYNLGSDDFEGNDFDLEGSSESDSGIAWQVTAGVRKAITYNIDFGVKYRYFNVRKLNYGDDFAELSGRYRSHSLLASLVYNFGAPPLPPPPVVIAPPPEPLPPATQTCPDGSVILATDTCPLPPEPYVPPPPPPVEPERG